MKSSTVLHLTAALRSHRSTMRRVACTAAALLSIGSQALLAQGAYYPVNPEGAPYGSTYTGTPVVNAPDLNHLQTVLQGMDSTLTLQVPPPTGQRAPNATELAAGVLAATQQILSGGAPLGVTLQTFARQVVAYRPSERGTSVDRISSAIVNDSVPAATKITNLNNIANTLATAQPLLIDTIVPSILGQAKTIAAVAQGIPQIVTTVVSLIPRDSTRVNVVVGSGISSIGSSALTTSQRTTLFLDPTTGYVRTLLASSQVDNSPALIDSIVRKFTEAGGLSLVPTVDNPPAGPSPSDDTPLEQVITAAVDALPTTNKYTVGALAAGALRSQGASAAEIQARLNLELSATPLLAQHTNELVDGYTSGSTLATYQAQLSGNTNADAVAQGATVRNALSTGVIVREALIAEGLTGVGSLTTARDVVKAVVAGNLDQVITTVNGAFNGYVPYGDATHADIAGGAVNAARIEQAGNITQATIQKSGPTSALPSATVNSIVDAAIVGADQSNKEGAFADIVYKAQVVVRNSPSATSVSMVGQAINSIGAATTEAGATINRPHYIALVAALAADNGANRTAIRNAALGGGGQIVAAGGDLVAATSGADLVRDIVATPGKAYATTLSALYAADNGASPTNSVKADVYASVLANSSESSAMLAAAIKQSSVSTNVLTDAAIDAIRGITAGKDQTLRLVRDVADYAKAMSLAGSLDILDYVGHQIIDNPSLTPDIAVAFVVVNPNNSNYVAHAVGFNAPTTANSAIGKILQYSQVTNPTPFDAPNPGNPNGDPLGAKPYMGTKGVIIDQPAVAAAITAGVVTGILEGLPPITGTPSEIAAREAARQSALVNTVQVAVAQSITQSNVNLLGPVNPFNFGGNTVVEPGGPMAQVNDANSNFRQSDGVSSSSIKTGTVRSVGAAGAITGFVAQVTTATDTTISPVTAAVLAAAASGSARPYALEIAQAAAQALRWVAGTNVIPLTAAADIANAIAPSVVGFATFAQLNHAALFGISEAANGTIGAGALGLNATGLDNASLVVQAAGNANSAFYKHRSATGTPVTDIFNL